MLNSKVLHKFSMFLHHTKRNIAMKSHNIHPLTIVVEGNIGSGKTSFLEHFKNNELILPLAEPVELWRNVKGHNLLDLMYKDPERWGFTFQTYVQLTMLNIHELKTNRPVKIMERSIFSARYCFLENLFQNGFMPVEQKIVLDEWFKWILSRTNVSCDLIVYLRTSPEVVYERIKKRSRNEEKCVPLSYLQSLHVLHENWLYLKTTFPLPAPILVLDANKDMSEMKEQYQDCEEQILQSEIIRKV